MFNTPESRESAPPGARKEVSNIQTPKLQQHTDTEATAHIDEELTGSGGCKFSNAEKKGVETGEKKGTGRKVKWCAERERADFYLVCSFIRSLANKNSTLFADARL